MGEFKNWSQAAELLPHVQALADYKDVSKLPSLEFGSLVTVAANYMRAKAEFRKGFKYTEIALTVLSSQVGIDDPTIVQAQSCVGRCYQAQGKYTEAEEM